MADLKLVGAVAIKVRPDATGFRKETQVEITKELKGVEATVPVNAELDPGKTKEDAKKLEKELQKTITWDVKLDHDSVRAAQKKFDSLFAETKPIKFKLDDPESIAEAENQLREMAEKAQVVMKVAADKKGFEQVLAKIDEIRRQNIEIPVEFKTDEASLAAKEKEMRDNILRIPAKIEYNTNVEGLRKVIKEIDAEMQRLNTVETEVILRPANLAFEKARMEAELGNLTVKIDYENNLSSLQAARRQILELLPPKYTTGIETKLDEASLVEALAKIDAMIAAAEATNKKIEPKVKPNLDQGDAFKVRAALAVLAKDITVRVDPKLNLAAVAFVAAKLTGLRAAARWSEELGRALGTLDRNLPVVAAVVLSLTELSKVVVNLAADAFSLGNDLGAIVRMGGILLPAAMLGLASVMTVVKGVFKDFGAAVNGDDKAIEKLTESGKKAAAEIRVVFQDIRETVSKNFWKEAGDSMLEFTNTALPKVRDGLANLSTSLGGIFARLLDSISTFAKQNGIDVFFTNLNRGFDVAQGGMAAFMNAFLTLASVGSTVFPRLGKAFEAFADRFDSWVQRLAADGTFNRWIDRGIEGLQNLFAAAGSLVKIWSNIGTAAQAAGALTLQTFAGLMAKLEQITGGAAFQRNLTNIFDGAREGADKFRAAVDIGPVMDVFSVTIQRSLALSGDAFGAFARDVADLLSSANLDKGMTAFLGGLKTMFEQLRPAMAPVSEIIRTFGEILGQVATDSGPLFRNLFEQLATVLSTAWAALQPFLPELIQIGTSIINIVGPAMTQIAQTIIPAFASGLSDMGDSMVPIIGWLSDMAVGFAKWLSAVPPSGIVAMATGILTLHAAFKALQALVPLATLALEAFGVQATLAAIRTQLMVPVVGLVLAGLTALTAGVVTELALQQGNATPYANDYAQALREDADAAKELGHVVRSSEIRTAIKNLFDSGAFDNAHKLGISTKTLTDAVVKQGPALSEVEKRVAAANKAYNEAKAASDAAGDGVLSYGDKLRGNLPFLKQQADAGNAALDVIKKSIASRATAAEQIRVENDALRAAGIAVEDNARKYDLLNEAMDKTPGLAGAAASAGKTLSDSFATTAAKVDAMRKTFDILVGKDAKQAVAETMGAYVSGFNDLKETVTPLAGKMQELGEAVYGDNGFLNVAGGNKAVLQVNQALVDEVNAVWAGAKATYDNAIKQGDNAQVAFQKARDFINERKGDFEELATVSGLNKDRVMGQWTSIFDHEWELKVSFNGLTEVTAKAQALSNLLGAKFDGQKFLAYLDANPDEAIKAVTGAADDVALRWVNQNFKAKMALIPDDVQDQLRKAIKFTDDEWVNADFATILSVSKKIPGLAEALIQIYNGVQGVDLEAVIKAAADHTTVEQARNELDEAAKPRTAPIEVGVNDKATIKMQEIEENKKRLAIPQSLQIDANTQPADTKLDVTKGKADTLGNTRPNPVVDANTNAADTKLDTTQGKTDKFAASRPNPFVDANTGTADAKLNNNLGWLGEIGRARPNSTVSVTDNASWILQGIINLLNGVTNRQATVTITTRYLTSGNPVQGAGNVLVDPMNSANGNILRFRNNIAYKAFANGGIERHVAQIARPGVTPRVWAEKETHGEAYIPYAQAKRPRSVRILRQVARDFGYDLTRGKSYANGGITAGPTTHTTTSANVHIGTMITTDMDAAVRKLNQTRRDALAVAGIR